jgi:hypothetical protein
VQPPAQTDEHPSGTVDVPDPVQQPRATAQRPSVGGAADRLLDQCAQADLLRRLGWRASPLTGVLVCVRERPRGMSHASLPPSTRSGMVGMVNRSGRRPSPSNSLQSSGVAAGHPLALAPRRGRVLGVGVAHDVDEPPAAPPPLRGCIVNRLGSRATSSSPMARANARAASKSARRSSGTSTWIPLPPVVLGNPGRPSSSNSPLSSSAARRGCANCPPAGQGRGSAGPGAGAVHPRQPHVRGDARLVGQVHQRRRVVAYDLGQVAPLPGDLDRCGPTAEPSRSCCCGRRCPFSPSGYRSIATGRPRTCGSIAGRRARSPQLQLGNPGRRGTRPSRASDLDRPSPRSHGGATAAAVASPRSTLALPAHGASFVIPQAAPALPRAPACRCAAP